MREGPEFVLWFATWGAAGVLVIVAISVALFWLFKRQSDRQTVAHRQAQRKRAGAKRQP